MKKLFILFALFITLSAFSETYVKFIFKSDCQYPITPIQPATPTSPMSDPVMGKNAVPVSLQLSSAISPLSVWGMAKGNLVLRDPDYPDPSTKPAMMGMPFEEDIYKIVMNVTTAKEVSASIQAKYKILKKFPVPPVPPSTTITPAVWEEHDFTIHITDPIFGDLLMPYGPNGPSEQVPYRHVDGLEGTGITVTSQKIDNSNYVVYIIANPK